MSGLRPESIQGAERRDAAFTLIEVLIAIGIFSMVMAAIYASWSSIMRGTRIGLSAAAEVQRTRVAIHALEASLSSTVMYADNPRYYSFFADTGSEYAFLSFVARLPESFPGSGLFAGQAVRRVTFQVDKDKNLLLSQSTLLDISEHPYTIKLAPNTRVFALEFYNPRKAEWLPEWISTNQLPVMVRVAIGFGDKNQANEPATIRTIPLSAMAITRVGGGMPMPNAPIQRPGAPGMQNGDMDVVGDEAPQWNPYLPDWFGANQGNAQLNPIFPQ